ncbi:hypothetical protein BRC81_08925 [Halobacteriales archaeon QS_1_68_20]|nr:MAG: hypothetical protein BRC81_08925 [Halobacteriales archaeon QS_1_68_20]
MAKRPTLVREDGDWMVAAPLESGRYRFALGAEGETLVREELGCEAGDHLPVEFVRTLVYAGDAWLPGSPGRIVEAGNDVAEPTSARGMTDEQARAIADYLRGSRFGDRQRSALREQLDRTPLGWYLSLADLRRTEDGSAATAAPVEDATDPGADPQPGSAGVDRDGRPNPSDGGSRSHDAGSTSAGSSRAESGAESTGGRATADEQTVTDDASGIPDDPADRSGVEAASVAYLADLDAADAPALDSFSADRLADLYALLSEIESRVGDLRTETRDALADRVADGQQISGEMGTVAGASRTRRSLRDESEVLAAVERNGFSREAVLTEQVDEDAVEELVEEARLDESAFYEVSETEYVRRVDVDADAVEEVAAELTGVRDGSGGGDRGASSEDVRVGAGADEEVPCPVRGCDYRNVPASVSAHVSGVHDDDHDWDALAYEGMDDYLARL